MKKNEMIIYTAGLIDGEGHIGFISVGKNKKCFGIEVKMTDLNIIKFLKHNFGGCITFQPRRKTHYKNQWKWRIKYKQARILFKQLYPYLLRPAFKSFYKDNKNYFGD